MEYPCISTSNHMGCGVHDVKADELDHRQSLYSATTAMAGATRFSCGAQFRLPVTRNRTNCRCGKRAVAANCDRQKCKHECVRLGGCSLSGHGGTRPVIRPRLSLPSTSRQGASNWRRCSAPPLTCASAGE